MNTIELTAPTLSNLWALIEGQPGHGYLFRGQSNAAWGLVPSLFRTKPNIIGESEEKRFAYYESAAIRRFFDEGLPYLPPLPRNYSNDRILAQHFGVPTRFLDWTLDPLVAAFFAVEAAGETDAAIFMLIPDGGSDIRPEDLTSPGPYLAMGIRPPAIDRRIPAQKSIFTWHPYGEPTEPFVPLDQRPEMGGVIGNGAETVRAFAKILIPSHMRPFLANKLRGMGIDRRNLFPGLDGVGAAVRDWADYGRVL